MMRTLAFVAIAASACAGDGYEIEHVYAYEGFFNRRELPCDELYPSALVFETGRRLAPRTGGGMGCAYESGTYHLVYDAGPPCAHCEDDLSTPENEGGHCVGLPPKVATISGTLVVSCPDEPAFGTNRVLTVVPRELWWMDANPPWTEHAEIMAEVHVPNLPRDAACTLSLRATVSDDDPTPLVSAPVAFHTPVF